MMGEASKNRNARLLIALTLTLAAAFTRSNAATASAAETQEAMKTNKRFEYVTQDRLEHGSKEGGFQ